MDHVTNIYGVFKKADMHLGASCLSSFCLLYHHHIAHVLCIALNFFLPVATYGHGPSNLHSFEGFNNHILFLCRRRVQKLLGAVSVLSGQSLLSYVVLLHQPERKWREYLGIMNSSCVDRWSAKNFFLRY